MGKKPTLGEVVELTGPTLGEEVELTITPPPDPSFTQAPSQGAGVGQPQQPPPGGWDAGQPWRTPSTGQDASLGGQQPPSPVGGRMPRVSELYKLPQTGVQPEPPRDPNAPLFDFKPEEPAPLGQYRGMDAQYEPAEEQVRKGLGLSTEEFQRNKQNVIERRARYGQMDIGQVQSVLTDVIPERQKTAQAKKASIDLDIQQFTQMRDELDALRGQAEQSQDPALIDQYNRDAQALNAFSERIRANATATEDLFNSIEVERRAAAARAYEIKSKEGGFLGATHNAIVDGVASVTSIVPDFSIDFIAGLAPQSMLDNLGMAGKTRDQAAKELKREFMPIFKESFRDMFGAPGVSKEYEQEMQKGFLGGAWLGLMQSAPAMATPMMSGIFLQVMEGTKEEMRGPEWDDVPEGEKNAMAALLAIPSTALERAGFRNLASNNPVVKEILARTISQLPKGASKEQIERVLNAETTSAVQNYMTRVAGGTLAEFETGLTQEVADVAIKDLYNLFLDGEGKFEVPSSWGEYLGDALKAGAQEAVGGFVMAQPGAVSAARRAKKNVGAETTDTQFELLEETLTNPEFLPAFEEQLKAQVEAKKLSEVQAQQVISDWKEAQQIVSKIPPDMQVEKRKEAFDLLSEKARLSKMEKALVADKIAAIDEKLAALAGVKREEKAPKTKAKTTELPPDPESVLLSQEENDRVAQARIDLGIEVDPLEGLTDGMVVTFNRVENDLPVSLSAVEEVADFLYEKYKELRAMKSAPKGLLTMEQIDGFMEQLGQDIELLETYKQQQRERAEGTTEQTAPKPTVEADAGASAQELQAKEEQRRAIRNEIAALGAAGPSIQLPDLESVGLQPRLRELGYTQEEISKMTLEQQQDIVEKKTEPARAESTARVLPQATTLPLPAKAEAEAFAINDIASAVENNRTRGVLNDDGTVSEVEYSWDEIDAEYGRIRALAERGKLTRDALAKSVWGSTLSTSNLEAVATALNNNPDAVDRVHAGIERRLQLAPRPTPTVEAAPPATTTAPPTPPEPTGRDAGVGEIPLSKKTVSDVVGGRRIEWGKPLKNNNGSIPDLRPLVKVGDYVQGSSFDKDTRKSTHYVGRVVGVYKGSLSVRPISGDGKIQSLNDRLFTIEGESVGLAKDIEAHRDAITEAMRRNEPIPADAIEQYGIRIPSDQGYSLVGDQYVSEFEKPTTSVPTATKTAPKPAKKKPTPKPPKGETKETPPKVEKPQEEVKPASKASPLLRDTPADKVEKATALKGATAKRAPYALPGFEGVNTVMVKDDRGWRPNIILPDGTALTLTDEGTQQGTPALAASEGLRILNKHGLEKIEKMAAAVQAMKGPVMEQKPVDQSSIEEFEKSLEKELGLKSLSLFITNQGDLKIGMIGLSKDQQGKGVGSEAMRRISDYADSNGLRIILSPTDKDANWGTTSRSRLVDFYKRFGFIENRGRSKDFSIREGMYRPPQMQQLPSQGTPASEVKISKKDVANMVKALSGLFPNATVVQPKTPKEYADALKNVGNEGIAASWGVVDFTTQTIYINPASPDKRQTLYHEGAHPVLYALAITRPDIINSLAGDLASMPGGDKYKKYGEQYEGSAIQRQQEMLAELLGDVTSGKIPVSAKKDSMWQRVKRFIQDVLAALGWDMRTVDLSQPQNVRDFAREFKRAMDKGIKITGLPQVGGMDARTMLQDDANRLVDRWYSRLRETVIAKGKTLPASEWLNWMQSRAKEGAFSMEEAKWTGLQDWLTSKGKEKVTPQQVREFLDENRVRVEVKELGSKVNDKAVSEWWNSQYAESHPQLEWSRLNERQREQAMIDYAGENDMRGDRTKFSQYQLPGGTNYREVLVTLPSKPGYRIVDKTGTVVWLDEDARITTKELADLRYTYPEEKGFRVEELSGTPFRSPHFDEPDILFHLRVNDRTDADGKKVLFIEEIQSDWAQKGRKEGFSDGPLKESEVEVISAKPITGSDRMFYEVRNKRNGLKNGHRATSEQDAIRQEIESFGNNIGKRGPSSAPFVTDTSAWVELAIKQAVRMAVEGNYDRVAWTKAQHHTDRWGTERIEWAKQPDGSFLVNAKAQHGGNAGGVDLEGEANAQNLNPQNSKKVSSREQLEETIRPSLTEGQDAKKLSEKLWQRMQSEESGVSMPRKEGFEGFYDKIVPTVAAKVIKKMGGGKVGETGIDVLGERKAVINETEDYFDIDGIGISDPLVDETYGSPLNNPVEYWVGHGADRAIVEAAVADALQRGPTTRTPQPSFDITPAMRDQAGLGLALMQKPDPTKVKNMADALRGMDITTAEEVTSRMKSFGLSDTITDAVLKEMGLPTMGEAQKPPAPPKKADTEKKEGKEVKKTIVTIRAYEGEFREEVKKKLAELGLYRKRETFDEAREKAKAVIDSIGIDAALEAVRVNDVPGGAGAFIWNEALKEIDRKIASEKDPQSLQELYDQQAELLDAMGAEYTSGGQRASALQVIFAENDLGFYSAKKATEWEQKFGEAPSEEMMAKWRERDKELDELRSKLKEAEEKLKKSKEQQVVKDIQESIDRERKAGPPRKYSKKAKVVADNFRKLKAKPMVFMDADGNPIEVKEMGFGWNELVEAGAKAIEKSGELADGVAAMIQALKNSKFYKGLDDRNKEAIEKQVREAAEKQFKVAAETDIEVGRISVPKKMIRDAVANGAKDIDTLVEVIKVQLKEEYPEATDREIRDAITGYGKVVNMSKDEISQEVRRLSRVGRIVSALEDVAQKKRPLRSGLQRDKLDAEERALNKKLKEVLKDLPVDSEVQERELRTALDAAKTRMRNRIEDLQREIDTKERIKRSGKPVQADDELKQLIEERDELQKQRDEIFGDKEITEQERLERAIDSAKRTAEKYEKLAQQGELDPAKPTPVKETPELAAARAAAKRARQEYRKLQDEAGILDKKRLDTSKKVANKRIEELRRRIDEGDFAKKESPDRVIDDELIDLNAQKIRLKEEYDKEFYKHKLKNRTQAEIWKDRAWEAWGLTRALQATGELSFVLIQGGAMSISTMWHRPSAVARAFKNMVNAMGSERRSEEWHRKIKAQDWWPQAKEAKLAITEPHAEVTAREELFMSDYTRLFWDALGLPIKLYSDSAYKRWSQANPFRAVERGAAAYLDTLRVERYLDGYEMLQMRGEEITKQDLRDVADAVNTLTGRASIGPLETISKPLTKIFFSPRLWASAIKTSTPYAFYHFGKMTPTARKMALQDMGRYVGTTMAFVALAAMRLNDDDDDETGVETDPRSSDFGKIKIGDTRIDPWGGRAQQVILTSRIVMGALSLLSENMGKGPVNAFKKGDQLLPLGMKGRSSTMFDTIIQMATNKLAPSAALLVEFAKSEVYQTASGEWKRKAPFKEDYSLSKSTIERLYPIYVQTVMELLEEDPRALEGFLIAYAFFGGGVQKYQSSNPHKGLSKPVVELFDDKGYLIKLPSAGSLKTYDVKLGAERPYTEDERKAFYKTRAQFISDDVKVRMNYLRELDRADFAADMSYINSQATKDAKEELGLD